MIKIYVECDKCHHSLQVYHLEWYALVCPRCRGTVNNELYNSKREESDQYEMAYT